MYLFASHALSISIQFSVHLDNRLMRWAKEYVQHSNLPNTGYVEMDVALDGQLIGIGLLITNESGARPGRSIVRT